MFLPLLRETAQLLGRDAVLAESRSWLLDRQVALGDSAPQREAFLSRLQHTMPSPVWQEAWKYFLAIDLKLASSQLVFARLESRLSLQLWRWGPTAAPAWLDRLSGRPYIPGHVAKACARQMGQHALAQSAGPEDRVRQASRLAEVFAEGVTFLDAFAWHSPNPDLEMDILVSHHSHYYQGHSGYESAPDVEPARSQRLIVVAPGHVFAFPVSGGSASREQARQWLRQGLGQLGIGARKSAGYGWFDTSDRVQTDFGRQYDQYQQTQQARLNHILRQEQIQREQETAEKAASQRTERLSTLSDEERLDLQLLELKENQFWGKLQNFRALDDDHKSALVRVLRNPRRPLWDELKRRARPGGQWAQVEHAVRAFARENDQENLP